MDVTAQTVGQQNASPRASSLETNSLTNLELYLAYVKLSRLFSAII